MILPTQDKELKDKINQFLNSCTEEWELTPDAWTHKLRRDIVTNYFLVTATRLGYHKLLPTSIEEALYSGDGSYRP